MGKVMRETIQPESCLHNLKKKSYIMNKLIYLLIVGEFMHELLLFILPGMQNYKCRWGLYCHTWETALWTLWQGCWTKHKAFISLNLSGHINPSLRGLSDEKLLEWFDIFLIVSALYWCCVQITQSQSQECQGRISSCLAFPSAVRDRGWRGQWFDTAPHFLCS